MKSVSNVVFRSSQDAVLQQYRSKLESSLNVYKSKPQVVELGCQQDILAKLSSQLQEIVAQRDVAQRQVSEKCGTGLLNGFVGLSV